MNFHDVSLLKPILDTGNYDPACSFSFVRSGAALRKELSVSYQVVSHVLLPLSFRSSLTVSWIYVGFAGAYSS